MRTSYEVGFTCRASIVYIVPFFVPIAWAIGELRLVLGSSRLSAERSGPLVVMGPKAALEVWLLRIAGFFGAAGVIGAIAA